MQARYDPFEVYDAWAPTCEPEVEASFMDALAGNEYY